jgi:hypothetical protein
MVQSRILWSSVTLCLLVTACGRSGGPALPPTSPSTSTQRTVAANNIAANGEALVSVGSPTSPFPQNKQNEPSIAVDPNNPQVLAAGANDEIDLGICNASGCFVASPPPGVSGIYFSFNGGRSWVQPTYTGWSGRTGTGMVGPIGTLPLYFENHLISDGDPGLVFGPRRGSNGKFSWANGSRLYYLNLTSNFSSTRAGAEFRGAENIAVSRTDNPQAAAANNMGAWFPPVIVVTRESAVTFSDKPAVWADDAAASPHFGNVYACWTSFRSIGGAPEPIFISHSIDGGSTWSAPNQLTAATNTRETFGRQGCTVRTDSTGVVYVFWEGAVHMQSAQLMSRSFDGGVSFERPRPVALVADVGAFDSIQGRFTFDGVAGARTNSFPSVDVANGAPTGAGATNEIVLAWSDARNGLNEEQALVQSSADRGVTWTTPVNGASAGDRPDFPAVAISPDGRNVFLDYMAFLDPWQTSVTSGQRKMQGVVNHASSTLTGWFTLNRGGIGDARGSTILAQKFEFLGDYTDVAATNAFEAAVWTDVRNAPVCPAVNAFRQSLLTTSPLPTPPVTACPATFGNSDIFSGTFAP